MRCVACRPRASTRNSPSIPTLRSGDWRRRVARAAAFTTSQEISTAELSAASVDSNSPSIPTLRAGALAGWLAPLVLQHPFPVLNLHHHPSARVEPEMIGLAHSDCAIGNFQAFGLLHRLA